MTNEAIPNLEGWEAYCEECKAFREARRAQERDVGDGTEYFEFVCNTCYSILLTFQRLGTEKPESKPAEIRAASARCPHCRRPERFSAFRPDPGVRLPALRRRRGCKSAHAIATDN